MSVECFPVVVSVESWKLVESEIWFELDIDSTIKIDSNLRVESILRIDQLPRLNWHDHRKTLHRHDQRKFIIKISKWLDPTKMLVESNPGSRINPRTRSDQYVSQVKSSESNQSGRAIKSDSRIKLESQINCLIRINSPIRPTFKTSSKRSSDQRILRQRYNFFVAYSFYVDPNLQSSGEIISRQQAKSTERTIFHEGPNLHASREIST